MKPNDALTVRCAECGRVFDLLDETDAQEWAAGHDCEAPVKMPGVHPVMRDALSPFVSPKVRRP